MQQTEEGHVAQKRKHVPLADVLHIVWKSEGKPEDSVWTTVDLSVPKENEECPITQEPMCSSFLDFLPGVVFRKEDPEYCKIQLKCGHAFAAMPITYHFVKNGMVCPLCREGNSKNLSPLCVPQHFRQALQEKIVIERAKDRVEADRENLAAAMLAVHGENQNNVDFLLVTNSNMNESLLIGPDGRLRTVGLLGSILNRNSVMRIHIPQRTVSAFLSQHRMCMIVYAYEPEEDLSPASVMELPADVWSLPRLASEPTGPADHMQIPYENNTRIRRGPGQGPDIGRNALVISLPRSSLRELGRNMRALSHPIRYRFVIGTRTLMDNVVEIARSELVDFTAPNQPQGAFGGIYVPSTSNPWGFDVRYLQEPSLDTGSLESVVWSIPEDEFVDFATLCVIRALNVSDNLVTTVVAVPVASAGDGIETAEVVQSPAEAHMQVDPTPPDQAAQASLEPE